MTPVEEAKQPLPDLPDANRHGFETGIPLGGLQTDAQAKAEATSRNQVMENLYQAYLACPPASACIDTISRMVTAGGLLLVPEDGEVNVDDRPLEILQLDALMKKTNAREDMIQLLRSSVADALTFGDGFVEVGSVFEIVGALWSLDATTMQVKCDEHADITGFVQVVDETRFATFAPDEVIHLSLDSPRGGVYGVSPLQKLMVPITAYLFTAAVLKEYMRRGAPPKIAVDLSKGTTPTEAEVWAQQYVSRNLGSRSIGRPIVTRVHPAGQPGTPPVMELQANHVKELLETLRELRDQIVSGFGMTPAMIGIIESGNLGGGTGEAQARTLHYGTILPLQNLILEKLNYRLLQEQGIKGWRFKFGEVEYRDAKLVEDIRQQRLEHGAWTLNRWRAEIGEPPVEGGDDAILTTRQGPVLWKDIELIEQLAQTSPAAALAQQQPGMNGQPSNGGVAPKPAAAPPAQPAIKTSKEAADTVALTEAWDRAYRAQRKAALKDLPRD